LIATSGGPMPALCGAYAPEPEPPVMEDAGMAGSDDAGPPPCVGVTCPGASPEGCDCGVTAGHGHGHGHVGVAVFVVWWMWRRRRR
jgi:MYXO-CTERM domain-containing protein